MLICDNTGIIWNTDKIDDKSQQSALENPVGCRDSVDRNIHLTVQEPHTKSFPKDEHNDGKNNLHIDTCTENFVQLAGITFSYAICDESAYCIGHSSGQDRKQRDDSTDSIIHTVILHTQRVQDYSAGIQSHKHYQYSPEIEEQSVLSYSSVALRVICHFLSNASNGEFLLTNSGTVIFIRVTKAGTSNS